MTCNVRSNPRRSGGEGRGLGRGDNYHPRSCAAAINLFGSRGFRAEGGYVVSIRAVKIRTQPPGQRHVQPPDLRAPSCIRNYGLRDRNAYCVYTHACCTRACQSRHGRYVTRKAMTEMLRRIVLRSKHAGSRGARSIIQIIKTQ